ncbi:MAG: 50S ribosomal protein L17 [Candidatus Marinimicrobia bacterium]|jgi:large subunit ribosomal protein L17|nr:50S ribosomal protein L17 [Candidatus Neomarinimicrobiota bacterium]MBT3496688.1 50S ribosomal protein L17 [Candidatus Neomarinimicrobiota bacterium]MBT3692992.1 50S ribosomal protein L17 [Candidatus Neomarinimicrobiota bacterium]MBT3731939.1 50S ribosomal protein L17 [Candidatus Neomarinimicrobiota bacterium]MBT4144442.1 50S ribosomal protein L17 [Candidatus Neomarinimicrobiota bacterium]
MRHRVKGKKLGRVPAHRRATLANLASNLILHKKIKTTDAKAKALRMFIEPLVTFAKRGDVHARRQVIKKIPRKNIVNILFDQIASACADRNGGYTRITKLGFRDNDRASVSQIEFIDLVKENGTEEVSSQK